MSRRWLEFGKGNMPVVSMHIGKDSYRALIDTGAGINFIEPAAVLRLGLSRTSSYTIYPLGGRPLRCATVNLPTIGFAGLKLPPCLAAISNVSSLHLNINFILGVNAFTQMRLQFDFPAGRIYIIE